MNRSVSILTSVALVALAGLSVNCRRNSQSAQPAAQPTAQPTAQPAAQPAAQPTAQPTAQPAAQAAPRPAPPPVQRPAPPAAPMAGSSFTPTAEDITAWQHANTILDYNAASHFGDGDLRTGFTPDPWPFAMTAGGGSNPVELSSLGIKDACTSSPAPVFAATSIAGTRAPVGDFPRFAQRPCAARSRCPNGHRPRRRHASPA